MKAALEAFSRGQGPSQHTCCFFNLFAVIAAKPLPKPPRSFDYTSQRSSVVATAPANWSRKAFNGFAAVVVQAGRPAGTIALTAIGPGLTCSHQTLVVR